MQLGGRAVPGPVRDDGITAVQDKAVARAAKLLLAAGAALATANCSSPQKVASPGGRGLDPKYGVAASPRVVPEGQPVPKGGGREMVGRPYVVAGKTYVPRENPNYSRVGLASWYGTAFHGRLTANGEIFDRESIAAAHPTLPLPSYARVTNLENGRSLIVRVNDRGPYHAGRLLDVSERAAEALAFHRVGTARVRVDYVGRASLSGSDDAKLLATLRTDGRPAPGLGGAAPVMVASAETAQPSPAAPARRAVALAAWQPPTEVEVDDRPRVTPGLRGGMSVAGVTSVVRRTGPSLADAAPARPVRASTAPMVASAKGVGPAVGHPGRIAAPAGTVGRVSPLRMAAAAVPLPPGRPEAKAAADAGRRPTAHGPERGGALSTKAPAKAPAQKTALLGEGPARPRHLR